MFTLYISLVESVMHASMRHQPVPGVEYVVAQMCELNILLHPKTFQPNTPNIPSNPFGSD